MRQCAFAERDREVLDALILGAPRPWDLASRDSEFGTQDSRLRFQVLPYLLWFLVWGFVFRFWGVCALEILGFIFTSCRVSGFEDLFGLLEDEGRVDRALGRG